MIRSSSSGAHVGRGATRAALLVPLLVLVIALVAGCAAGAATPALSFDPTSPCETDGRAARAYPELEAMLPVDLGGAAPLTVDSGRSCTREALGALYDRGVRELRYAGATWELGGEKGATAAVFEADRLDAEAMIAFYEAGARATGRAEALAVRPFDVAGVAGTRMDTIHRSVGQTIVAWPTGTDGRVRVVLTSAVGESELAGILEDVAG